MGALEKELEAGITYMPSNAPETIAATVRRVLEEGEYRRNAKEFAQLVYGPAAVAKALTQLLEQAKARE
jgi:UDP:flavonoid glycosyltransferase YjiC (YdhE family)